MKESIVFITESPLQTKKTGKALAQEVLKTPPGNGAFCMALSGDLGGGKTTFLQGFASGLGIKEKILSPTFIIYKRNRIKGPVFKNFYHFDCYRLKETKEVVSLGFKEIILNPHNIVVVEWAERIKKALPKNTLFLKFDFIDYSKRKIHIRFNGK
ncbi:MAG: tRNA (adenosine(37)-N6)-threonylcarbamoyltransferase complex ATPase subunit type 1 TsaE [Candidatus Nealsonbacteria bacterium]